jgi:hypothetical protein
LFTDKLTAALQIAHRVYSLAQDQNDSVLLVGAYRTLTMTLYFLGDFESARQHATHSVQLWRSEAVEICGRAVFLVTLLQVCCGSKGG